MGVSCFQSGTEIVEGSEQYIEQNRIKLLEKRGAERKKFFRHGLRRTKPKVFHSAVFLTQGSPIYLL